MYIGIYYYNARRVYRTYIYRSGVTRAGECFMRSMVITRLERSLLFIIIYYENERAKIKKNPPESRAAHV